MCLFASGKDNVSHLVAGEVQAGTRPRQEHTRHAAELEIAPGTVVKLLREIAA
jgi:hypothetical protein